jgi:hypothetical protein
MARSVPKPDSDLLKHRFCLVTEKGARRSLPVGSSNRQNLPREWQFLPSRARQIIPLCGKQAAFLLENFA